jgi:hypothetical protein
MKKEREAGFDLSFSTSKLPEYNGLFDSNLRHYFENRKVQKHLSHIGMVRYQGAALVWRAPQRLIACPAPTLTLHCTAVPRTMLYRQIDHDGHVIDLSRNMGKLSIIEQEFRVAEKAEQQRLREEAEMRVRALCFPAAAAAVLHSNWRHHASSTSVR